MVDVAYEIRPARADDAMEYVSLKNLVWRHAYKDILPEEVFVSQESKAEKLIDGFADHFLNYGRKDKIFLSLFRGRKLC